MTLAEPPVTRVEVLEGVRAAFDRGSGATRERLVAAARAAGARPAVLDALRRLPEGPHRSVRDLWAHLPDLAVR